MGRFFNACRISTVLARAIIGIATVVSCFAAAADDDAVREPVDVAAPGLPRLENYDGALDEWVFGVGTTAAAARTQVGVLLREKLEVTDRCCRLTEGQKRKIQLAGQGDIRRFFDRVAEVKPRLLAKLVDANMRFKLNDLKETLNDLNRKIESELSDEEAAFVRPQEAILTKAIAEQESHLILSANEAFRLSGQRRKDLEILGKETQSLKHCLRFGLSDDRSLFFKSLDTLLTNEQAVVYQPVRGVFRAGGMIRIRGEESDEILEIRLSGARFGNDLLAHLGKLPAAMPSLGVLWLDKTQVTDSGLAELSGLNGMRELFLDNTQVTDVGIGHLKRMTSLQVLSLINTRVTDKALIDLAGLPCLESLWLSDTRVTDNGVAKIERALPRLRVVW